MSFRKRTNSYSISACELRVSKILGAIDSFSKDVENLFRHTVQKSEACVFDIRKF